MDKATIINKDQQRIRIYYEEAKHLLQVDDLKEANRVLLQSMPKELYDLSMDILYNLNEEFSNNPLRILIREVDRLLGNADVEMVNLTME